MIFQKSFAPFHFWTFFLSIFENPKHFWGIVLDFSRNILIIIGFYLFIYINMPTYYAQATATASAPVKHKFRKPGSVSASASASATSTESQSDAYNSAYSIAQSIANQNANTHANLLSQSVDVSTAGETTIPLGSSLLDGYINQTGTNTWTMVQNYTIPNGYTLVIGADETLNVAPNSTIYYYLTFTIDPGATLQLAATSSECVNYCNFDNSGTITNEGTFANYSLAFNNLGVFTNNGTLINGNGYDLAGTFLNYGGTLTNTATIINNSSFQMMLNPFIPPLPPPPPPTPPPPINAIINNGIFTNNDQITISEGTFFYTNSITGNPVTGSGKIESYTTSTTGILQNNGKYANPFNNDGGTLYCNSYP